MENKGGAAGKLDGMLTVRVSINWLGSSQPAIRQAMAAK
jgi:hypothetical protein